MDLVCICCEVIWGLWWKRVIRYFLSMHSLSDRLKQLDDWLISACLTAESLYKVLYWDSHLESSRYVWQTSQKPIFQEVSSKLVACYVRVCACVCACACVRARACVCVCRAAGSTEGCCLSHVCCTLFLWAGCWLGSPTPSSCGTETSAEVSVSPCIQPLCL